MQVSYKATDLKEYFSNLGKNIVEWVWSGTNFNNNYKEFHFKIDSFKLKVPLRFTKYNTSLLADKVLVNSVTGEIDETSFRKGNLSIDDNGIKTKFAIAKQHNLRTNCTDEFLVIQMSAKILKESYFDGITIDNISIVLSYLNTLKYDGEWIVNISPIDFFGGFVSDVDWCLDIRVLNRYEAKAFIDSSVNYAQPKVEPKQFGSHKSGKTVAFGSRTAKDGTTPLLKFYDKYLELTNRSHVFANKYLELEQYENLVRIEFQVKGRKQLREAREAFIMNAHSSWEKGFYINKKEQQNLGDLLIQSKKGVNIDFRHVLSKYFKCVTVINSGDKHNAKDFISKSLIVGMYQSGMSPLEIESIVMRSAFHLTKMQKSRLRKKMNEYLAVTIASDTHSTGCGDIVRGFWADTGYKILI